MPDPDEFDQQLRNLTSGQAEPARFTELSAAERARRNPGPPPPAKRNWRKARKAKQLREPISDPTRKRPGPGGIKRRPAGSKQRKPNAANRRRRQLASLARTVGILIAFAALLYGLHLLGFGPQ